MSVADENRNYTIYMHVNKVNNKKYIGITSLKPRIRWQNGKGYIKNRHFYRSIQKYGWNKGFNHIIIGKGLSQEEAEYFEILLIKIWKSNDNNYGYNISSGGGLLSKETRLKISKALIGKKASKETRLKLSESHKGIQAGDKHPNARKVMCDNKIFNCAKDCADYYNINGHTLRDWLRGGRRMPQDFFDMNLHYIDSNYEVEPQSRYSKTICGGVIYKTAKECADYYGVKPTNMNRWLKGDRRMPQKFIDLGLRYTNHDIEFEAQTGTLKGKNNPTSKQVYTKDKIFDSLSECAEYYNVKIATMSAWLLGKNKTPQKYIDLGLRYATEEDLNTYELVS